MFIKKRFQCNFMYISLLQPFFKYNLFINLQKKSKIKYTVLQILFHTCGYFVKIVLSHS